MALSNMTLIATLSSAMLQAREAFDSFRANWQNDQPQSKEMQVAAKHYKASIARMVSAVVGLIVSQNRNVTAWELSDRAFLLNLRIKEKSDPKGFPQYLAALVQGEGGQRLARISRNKMKDSDSFEDTSIGNDVELVLNDTVEVSTPG